MHNGQNLSQLLFRRFTKFGCELQKFFNSNFWF
jgi:hypothetical protein